jgi:acetylornithine deacetylase/succinyl-diaminopimelate desuccinylase-like protein
MDQLAAKVFIDALWDADVIPELTRYIRIPNKSPAFDPDWEAHGFMAAATAQFATWARAKIEPIDGATLEVVRLPGRTPVIFIEIPGAEGPGGDDPVLLYGHLDKQPEMTGWAEGLGPWTPVLKDGRLYGRGGADDGYAMFGALSAILALQAQGTAHARCAVLIEACEESGSYDLPFYVDHLAARLGSPSLVVCLDSGCANYDQLWLTTSLRGMAGGALTVQVLTEGVHSGDASGIVPSSFRILRSLISRLEDETTGEIKPSELHAQIPPGRIAEAKAAAAALGDEVFSKFPFVPGMRPMDDDPAELILNRTWRPALAVTGLEGAPEIRNAGNVLRPATAAKLSLRLPPTADAEQAGEMLKSLLEADPPYGARVTFAPEQAAGGWNAPALAPWLRASVDRASQAAFGRPAALMGEGGSIPFMGMLGETFPAAQFVITGVLGPHSNAHGPNEFLHIAMGKGVSLAVAQVLADHLARDKG